MTGIATAKIATRLPPVFATITIAKTNITGALKQMRVIIWKAIWTFWTSVVILVISDDAENESMFLNEKSCR